MLQFSSLVGRAMEAANHSKNSAVEADTTSKQAKYLKSPIMSRSNFLIIFCAALLAVGIVFSGCGPDPNSPGVQAANELFDCGGSFSSYECLLKIRKKYDQYFGDDNKFKDPKHQKDHVETLRKRGYFRPDNISIDYTKVINYENMPSFTAQEWYNVWKDNPLKAEKSYKGKSVKISGEVYDSGKNWLGQLYVELYVPGIFASVNCLCSDSEFDIIANLEKRQRVTIIGSVDFNSAMLSDCTIQINN